MSVSGVQCTLYTRGDCFSNMFSSLHRKVQANSEKLLLIILDIIKKNNLKPTQILKAKQYLKKIGIYIENYEKKNKLKIYERKKCVQVKIAF